MKIKQVWTAHYNSIAKAIHYPECWDTAAYPDIESALSEIFNWFSCSTCSLKEKGLTMTSPFKRENYLFLCADCGHQIGESTEIHPSLCPTCENKIIQTALSLQPKKDHVENQHL
ncbi:MAG: hypothetical protein JZU65_10720 [Chlorobium sp.]|nr:hypothetical protein [Chlorobium sp.]